MKAAPGFMAAALWHGSAMPLEEDIVNQRGFEANKTLGS